MKTSFVLNTTSTVSTADDVHNLIDSILFDMDATDLIIYTVRGVSFEENGWRVEITKPLTEISSHHMATVAKFFNALEVNFKVVSFY